MSKVDDFDTPEIALRKLTQGFGVIGYVILSKNGNPIKFQGMNNKKALQYAALISELCIGTNSFLQEQAPESDTDFVTVRLRTRKHELIIAPEGEFILVVVQDPNYTEPEEKKEEEKQA